MFEIKKIRIMTDGVHCSGCGPVIPGMFVEIEVEGDNGPRFVLGSQTIYARLLSVYDSSSIDFAVGIMKGDIEDEYEIDLFNDNAIEMIECVDDMDSVGCDEPEYEGSAYSRVYDVACEILDEIFGEISEKQIPGAENQTNKKWVGKRV